MVFGIKMRIEPKTFVSLRDGGLSVPELFTGTNGSDWSFPGSSLANLPSEG